MGPCTRRRDGHDGATGAKGATGAEGAVMATTLAGAKGSPLCNKNGAAGEWDVGNEDGAGAVAVTEAEAVTVGRAGTAAAGGRGVSRRLRKDGVKVSSKNKDGPAPCAIDPRYD